MPRPTLIPHAPLPVALLGLLALGSCGEFGDVTPGVCGNYVLDPGESCDRPGPGCGGPDSDVPCRLTCEASACTRPGDVCGSDRLCRRPLGTYTLAAPLGAPGDTYDLVDVDGDGAIDMADRSFTQVTLYRNDGHGMLRVLAGSSVSPDESVQRAVAAGRFAPSDPQPLLAVVSYYGVSLLRLDERQALTPLVVPTTPLLPVTQQLLGALTFPDRPDPAAVVYDALGAQLLAIDLGDQPVPTVAVSLARCGARPGSKVDGVVVDLSPGGRMALVVDQTLGCEVETAAAMGRQLIATPLGVDPIRAAAPDFQLTWPTFGDFDGDGLADVAMLVGANQNARFAVATWPGLAPGTFGSPTLGSLAHRMDGLDLPSGPLVAGDLNGDHRDDLADAYDVMFSQGKVDAASFTDQLYVDVNLYFVGPAIAIGDLNRDQHSDLVLTGADQGTVVPCFGAGPAKRFSCYSVPTTLRAIEGTVLADVNADGSPDVVTWGLPPAPGGPALPDGGVPDGGASAVSESRISVVFGRAGGLPDPAPQLIDSYGARVTRVARTPPFSYPQTLDDNSDGLLVGLAVAGGLGFARGQAITGAGPAFDLNVPAFESRFADGKLLIVRCDQDNSGNYTQCGLQVYRSDREAPFTLSDRRGLNHPFPAGVDAYSSSLRFADLPGSTLPSLVWVEDGGVLVGAISDAPTVAVTQASSADGVSLAHFRHLGIDDVDGDDDPAGPGRNEIVVVASVGANCKVLIGRTAPGATAPTQLVTAATVESCLTEKDATDTASSHSADFARGAPFFVPHAGPETGVGRDLVLNVLGPDGRTHLARLPALGQDRFGAPELDPPLFHLDAQAHHLASLPAPADYRFLASTDIDRDGAPDLVFRTPLGMVVALADTDAR